VSKTKMTWAVFRVVILMLLLVTLMGEWVAPMSTQLARAHKAMALSGGQALHTQHGTWLRDGNDFIHIETLLADGELQGVTRYAFDGHHHLQSASYAKSGVYRNGHWVFKNIQQSRLGQDKVTTSHFAQQTWPIQFNPKLLAYGEVSPDEESLKQIYQLIRYRHHSGLQSSRYEFSFWKRVFQPLNTLIMTCLALAFIFGPLRTVSVGLRIVSGVVVGFGFFTLNQFLGPFSMVYQFPALASAALPSVLFGLLAGYLLWKGR